MGSLLYPILLLACLSGSNSQITLTVLHTNDVHARIEQTNGFGATCSVKDAAADKCFGGVARRYTVVESIRRRGKNVLLMDGGDQFQGTLWYNLYRGRTTRIFMNRLGYDVMALGNHEFDDGVAGLLPFLKSANFSVISANINGSAEPLWPMNPPLVKKSVVMTIEGTKVGVIGYTIRSTVWISSPGPNLKFSDEVQAVKMEAARLKASGVNIIIALGHAGIQTDMDIAMKVPDVDIVVGGHSNTFLYTGNAPSSDVPSGPYPLVVNSKIVPNHRTLVVQASALGKYLGNLSVTFDSKGEVSSYSGNPILLDKTYPENPSVLAMVNNFTDAIRNFSKVDIGQSHVFLDGERKNCRTKECNLGNLITDAMVEMNARAPDEEKWADVSIAVFIGGGIRASIDKKVNEYITYGDLATVLPFGNTADIVTIRGLHLKQVLEHSVSEFDKDTPKGRFLQVSGLRVVYDMSQPDGSKLKEVHVLCGRCRVPAFLPLNTSAIYTLLVPAFIANGGDGFTVFTKHTISRHTGSNVISHVSNFIRRRSPIVAKLDQRITYYTNKCKPTPNGNSPFKALKTMILFTLAFQILLLYK